MGEGASRENIAQVQDAIEIKISRSKMDPEDDLEFSTYLLKCDGGMSLHNALGYIYENLDPSIAYRPFKCNKGACMSCVVAVNGKLAKACTTILKPGDRLVVGPKMSSVVVRDLVTIS
jgi:succinate dehydrogenase/fumarate reductase-like Fe-S protein